MDLFVIQLLSKLGLGQPVLKFWCCLVNTYILGTLSDDDDRSENVAEKMNLSSFKLT